MPFDLGAAAGQLGMDLASGFVNNAFASRRQEQAQHFESDMYRSRYQMQVADLKAAGLNPMLAYMQSPGGAPSSSAASANGVDFAGKYNSGKIASAQEALMQAETAKTIQDKETSRSVQNLNEVEQLLKVGMTDQVAQQTMLIKNNAQMVNWTIQKIQKELPLLEQDLANKRQEEKTGKASEENLKSQAALNQTIQQLKLVETILVGKQSELAEQEKNIRYPKETAAGRWGAHVGAHMENVWKILNPFSGIFRFGGN